jgi:serine/threonine protein kinase
MGADVNVCPVPRELERLLAEQLGGPDRDAVEAHVERCSSCQDRLDRLIGASPAPGGSVSDSSFEPDDDFLSRLKVPPRATGPSSAASAVDLLEFKRLGQYEILGSLAAGGMGAVYKARHIELGKVVAVKVLPAEKKCEANVARFKQEVRAMGRLEHPNIVAAHDAGEENGVRYLVMAFVDGIDLARLVDRRGPLPVAEACELARQAAVGLQHAFEKGLVHRDVKPQNLMLARDGTVKVLDLGLARSFVEETAETLTAAGTMLGTADYLAPEQWDSPHAADVRADIYGLGCTLYHLVVGRPPFGGEEFKTVLKKMQAHQQVPPPPVAAMRADVPAGLASVLDRMLAKDPADRYATPAEVAEALGPFTEGADPARLLDSTGIENVPANQAVATPGPSRWETAPLSGRRRKPEPITRRDLLIAVGRALAVTLPLVAAAVALWYYWPTLWGSRAGGRTAPPTVSDLLVKHIGDGETDRGDLRTSTAAVRVRHGVTVEATFSASAYYYLIAFNPAASPAGVEQLCQPDDVMGFGDPAAVPEPKSAVRFPRDGAQFKLDAPGLQAFVLVASSKPLPPYKEWRAKAGEIPWPGTRDGGSWRWYFDGREYSRLPQERGSIEGAPKPLRDLSNWFKNRPEFEVVRVFAFPVIDR